MGPARLALAFLLVSWGARVAAQSAHLSALDGSAPTPVVEPIAHLPIGISGVFGDPTMSPRATGAFFSLYNASYASIRLFHGAIGWRWGPRWSLSFASTEIESLFDSSLTRQDPGLNGLHARALMGGLNATIGSRWLAASVGVGIASDDNVGDVQTSTVVATHLRVSPFARRVSLGMHWTSTAGGSLNARPGGRRGVDVTISHDLGPVTATVTGATQRGAYWRYSEVTGGSAVAARFAFLSQFELSLGLGRYETSYGASRHEWQRSLAAGLILRNVRFSVRYTSTALGLGSGYGVSLGYEPQAVAPGVRP
jgi:hypothetical protein